MWKWVTAENKEKQPWGYGKLLKKKKKSPWMFSSAFKIANVFPEAEKTQLLKL